MNPSSSQVKLLKAGLFLFSVSGTFALFAYFPLIVPLVPGQPASSIKPQEMLPVAPSSAVKRSSPPLPQLIHAVPATPSRPLPQRRSLL